MELNLSNHAIHTIPSFLLTVPRMVTLDLSRNFISTLSLSIHPLNQLRVLDLSHNLMTGLPAHFIASLPHLVHLAQLNLSHNQIRDLASLPSHHLRSLTHLDLSHNRLTTLPSHLSSLTKLTLLKINGNALTGSGGTSPSPHVYASTSDRDSCHRAGKDGVPEILHFMPSLVSLDLAQNPIRSLTSRFFASITGLESLDLSQCSITNLQPGFSAMAKLRVLNLSDNPDMQGLPSDLWQLASLEEFYARYEWAHEHVHS